MLSHLSAIQVELFLFSSGPCLLFTSRDRMQLGISQPWWYGMSKVIVKDIKCQIMSIMFRSCSGLILTSYSKTDPDNSFKEILSLAIDEYNIHKKRFILAEKFKGYKIISNFSHLLHLCVWWICRSWIEIGVGICKNLFWRDLIWQNHQRQIRLSNGQTVCHWRHHGSPHWLLHHQWSGDCLLWSQDHSQSYIEQEEETF